MFSHRESVVLLRTLALMTLSAMVGYYAGTGGNPSAALAFREPSVYNYISFDVKPERREEFLASIHANEKDTLALEPAARAYRWGEDINVPNRFHFHEEYAGGASGFQAHLDSAHLKQWNALVATDPFTATPNGPRAWPRIGTMPCVLTRDPNHLRSSRVYRVPQTFSARWIR